MPRVSDDESSDIDALITPRGPVVIGHRGASHDHPENTLLSFEKAAECGAHAIELDIRCSRDDVPFVIHDETVDRTTDGSGRVADLPARVLQRLDAGSGERVPTLAEVLASFRTIPLLLEVKDRRASDHVVDVVKRLSAERRVVVGSFQHSALVPFRRASIATTASRRETALWWAGARVRFPIPWFSYVAFSVPEHSGRLHVVDRSFLRCAHRRALPVHVWTVDDEVDAARLWSAGVTGLITNKPRTMVQLLGRLAKQWRHRA